MKLFFLSLPFSLALTPRPPGGCLTPDHLLSQESGRRPTATPRALDEKGEGAEKTRGPCRQPPSSSSPPPPAPPSPGQRRLERGSPLQAAVMDGSGSRRFERNSLGLWLYSLHSLHAQTPRWLRRRGENEFPLRSTGKEVSVGSLSSIPLSPLPQKKQKKKRKRKIPKPRTKG